VPHNRPIAIQSEQERRTTTEFYSVYNAKMEGKNSPYQKIKIGHDLFNFLKAIFFLKTPNFIRLINTELEQYS
jgi:hypothetical protein